MQACKKYPTGPDFGQSGCCPGCDAVIAPNGKLLS